MRDTNEMEVIFDSCSSNERFARVAVASFFGKRHIMFLKWHKNGNFP